MQTGGKLGDEIKQGGRIVYQNRVMSLLEFLSVSGRLSWYVYCLPYIGLLEEERKMTTVEL